MTKAKTLAAITAGLLLVGGCGISSEIAALKKMPTKGDAFMHALHMEYAALAEAAEDRGNDDAADFYYDRGKAAAEGKKVDPLGMKDRELPKGVDDEIEAARLALIAVLRGGAPKKSPNNAALAQATFDCWMEEVSLSSPAKIVQECRNTFDKALKRIEDALAAK